MKILSSRRLWRLCLLLWCGALPVAAYAQGRQRPAPFVEPSEMKHKTKAMAVEEHPAQNGMWATLPFEMPINPVHVALMHTGKVLVIAGSGNDPDDKNFQAAVWDPKTYTIKTFQITWDMFCNGMVILPDGRPLVLGGTLQYDPFHGEPRTAAFDPVTEKFTNLANMSGGRWYPTGTVLGNGTVLVYSGYTETRDVINKTVQIGTGSTWSPAGTAFDTVQLYPREHLLPDGKVFECGFNPDAQIYDPATKEFTPSAVTNFPSYRIYGTSVLLPLTPANGFKPKVMILGGAAPNPSGTGTEPATDTTELIDLSVPSPKWIDGPKMVKGRIQLNATLLPNGKVLVSGGSVNDEDNNTAVKQAELYDPESNTFSSASTMEVPRLYHSNTLLLPDATVVALGGNPVRKVYQPEIEIYSPPYLFNADGSPAKRPRITGAPSGSVGYGAVFQVNTPDAPDIQSVVLIRPGAVTHAFDMDQRLVGLPITQRGTGFLHVKAPASGNFAPPGYYLLFILNSKGVPSVARFVRLGAPAAKYAAAKPK